MDKKLETMGGSNHLQSDPYLVLGIDGDADDETVHAAYLAAIRACPPESDAERFAAVRRAYEALCTERDRLARELLDPTPPSDRDLLDRAAPRTEPERPAVADIQAVLRGED